MTNVEHTRPVGRIITFYSYKGGTGRTMAMANVAWLLACNGYRVLAIDWDLESPGLHRYFHPFLRDKELRKSDGVIDLIRNYADTLVQPGGMADASAPEVLAPIDDYAISLSWNFPAGGGIDFVPAGRQDSAYATKVSTFDWDSFWKRLRGGRFIDALRDAVRVDYDFILIDSRTGTSDTAGICTVRLPDTVVNCFTLNRQSIDGARAITESIHHQRGERAITVYPLPTRIEDGEQEKLDRGRTYARRKFTPFLTLPDGEDPDSYWDAVEVPYIPYYAYEEMLAAFGDRPRRENTLLARYQRLATRLAGRECDPPSISESERVRIRREFEHSPERELLKVLVAYAPLDRIWAEWIREQLNAAGQVTELHCLHDPLPAVDNFDRVITVISRDYLSFDAGPLWRLGTEHVATGDTQFLVGVRVDAAPLGQHVAPRSVVDVLGVAEERALQMLLRALGLVVPARKPEPIPGQTGIRYPALLAPYFNVQLERNPRFSGRGRVLGEIRDRLLRGGTAGARLALTGLPGVGKTQLALEYVYRFAASYDIIWWTSVERPDRARIGLSNLAERLKVAPAAASLETQVTLVLDALATGNPTPRWLIVFDNADEPDAIADLLPSGPGHVLITSRNPQWSQRIDPLEVDVFQRRESVELLSRRVPGMPTRDAERLAERLGDLPLAVEQASGWISTTGMTVTDYLSMLDAGAAKAMDEGVPPGYRQTITATVRVALRGLRERNLAAAGLLELFSFLAPVLIPYRLVSNKRLLTFLTAFDAKMHDPLLHGTLISEIGRYALARVDSANGGLVVHRLTQEIIRSELTEDEERERRDEVQAILAAVERGDPDDPKNWSAYELLRPHLEPAGVLDSASAEVRQLVIDMARYLWQRGDYPSSMNLARAALGHWSARFDADDSSTLMLRFQLAIALRAAGHEEEAYRINRDSHERLIRTVGPRHPYTLMTAFSLAADLRVRGEYHEARERDEVTAQAMREVLGADHPQTLAAVNNLAVSLWLVGRFREAAERNRETHQGRRKVLGPEHPYTLISAMNYGGAIRELGDLRGSRNTLETTLEANRRVLGEDHPSTLRAAMDFVVTCRRLGEVEDVSGLIADTATRYERVLGRSHPQTISCHLEQACMLWALGRHDDARRTAEEAYALCRQELGQHHPHTLAAGNDLGIFRRAVGDLEASRRLAEKTAERLQGVLGPRHPYTLVGFLNLANALYADGARAEARQRDEEVYGRLRGVLDDDHPTVLAAATNHAISHRVHDPEKAATLLADVVQRYQDVLGPDHPDTRAARESNRIDVDIAPLPL